MSEYYIIYYTVFGHSALIEPPKKRRLGLSKGIPKPTNRPLNHRLPLASNLRSYDVGWLTAWEFFAVQFVFPALFLILAWLGLRRV